MVADSFITRPPHSARPSFKREQSGARKPFKPKPWSHQRDLEALKGKKITFLIASSVEWQTGVLVEADQFTLKIAVESIFMNGQQSLLTYFKSQFTAYAAA